MDVRCEKCQTEYELDEARLKPGGVTVKCTNCGHMFKIRKRAITNVGAPPAAEQRTRPASSKPPFNDATLRADSTIGDDPDGPTTVERQWLIRLENGETRSCRELATLQQWIVGGIVTPESLISRTGKTWKRLGDIGELMQYFAVADEARTTRQPQNKVMPSTMLGLGAKSSAAGGTILPDDDGEAKTTGNFKARGSTTPPPAPKPRTPAMGVSTKPPPTPAKTAAYTAPPPPRPTPAPVNPLAETAAAPATPPRRPITQPPPPPAKKLAVPGGNRSTAAWATEGETPHVEPTGGPFGGKLAAIPNEPAFASSKLGKVRTDPADESAFSTGKVKTVDDDDDMMPARRGSRAGTWLLVMALLVMGGAGGVIYMFVIRKHKGEEVSKPAVADAAVVALVADAAPPVITPLADAAAVEANPLEPARAELTADIESRVRAAMTLLEGKDDPAAQALRARLAAQLAQDLLDRANLSSDKAEAEKLRKEAKTIVIDAATLAQRAYKAKSDSASANLAMAEVLRLQGKSARDIKRYLDAARGDKDLAHDVALADALLLVRDGKLDDAKVALAKLDGEVGAADIRPRFHLALIALSLGKSADAKTLVDGIAATSPEHAGAHALGVKLETLVAKSDPLPPEDHQSAHKDAGVGPGSAKVPEIPVVNNGGGGGSYDSLLAQAEKIADTNCTRALELYGKALEQKPNGVEALTGMGYCHIESKQFSSAHSNFRSALAVSARYEPALYGIAEAYQQQGLKDQAIKAYKEYLDVYPNAAKAQKQLDRLGAGAGDGNGSAPPPPPTPPTPPPTPPPAPPTGDGSGSS